MGENVDPEKPREVNSTYSKDMKTHGDEKSTSGSGERRGRRGKRKRRKRRRRKQGSSRSTGRESSAPFLEGGLPSVPSGSKGSLPSALQTRQKARVQHTKAQFHSWFFPTVDTPMKMKIRVSLTLLSIFMKYLMVV